MPLSLDSLLVQPSNSGSFVGASGTASLPTGTTAGSTVLIICGSSAVTVSASGFTDDGDVKAFVLRKSNVGADETSWALSAQASTLTRWTAYELAGLDPAYPIDVAMTSTTTSTGTTASTGTSARSTTYDGLWLAVHASHNSSSTTPTTFSGHTNGMTEMDEGSASDVTLGDAVDLSVSMMTTQQLGTFETTATASVTLSATNQATAVILCYTATDAKREANILHFWAFKVGAGAAGLGTGVAGNRYIETIGGTPAITADGLQLASSAAAENAITATFATLPDPAARAVVVQTRLRFDGSLPSVDTDLVTHTGSQPTVLRYVAASQKFGLKCGTGSEVLSDATVAADTWYTVELRMVTTATPNPNTMTGDWQIDYGAGPVVQTQATAAVATSTTATVRLGWTGAITVPGVTFAHLLVSVVAGHYPLGPFTFALLKADPAGTLTISGTSTNFLLMTSNATGAAWNAATALTNITEGPPPTIGASAAGFLQATAAASDYVNIPMDTYDASGTGSIRAVRMLACGWAASGTAATIGFRAHDGSAETTLLAATDPEFDNSTTTPAWVCKMYRPTNGWTQAKLDALAFRVGFSGDATPDIGIHWIGAEVAVQEGETVPVFGGTDPLRVEQLTDPVSGGILALHAYTPSGQTATLNYEVNGVAQGPISVPADSNPLIEVIDAPDAPTVNRIELIPD